MHRVFHLLLACMLYQVRVMFKLLRLWSRLMHLKSREQRLWRNLLVIERYVFLTHKQLVKYLTLMYISETWISRKARLLRIMRNMKLNQTRLLSTKLLLNYLLRTRGTLSSGTRDWKNWISLLNSKFIQEVRSVFVSQTNISLKVHLVLWKRLKQFTNLSSRILSLRIENSICMRLLPRESWARWVILFIPVIWYQVELSTLAGKI